MKLYVGHLPADYLGPDHPEGIDLLLTVHDDNTHELASRPGVDRRWERWSPPVTLSTETPGHTLQPIPDLVHAGDCLETRCLTCGCCAHCVIDGHCTSCTADDCVCAS